MNRNNRTELIPGHDEWRTTHGQANSWIGKFLKNWTFLSSHVKFSVLFLRWIVHFRKRSWVLQYVSIAPPFSQKTCLIPPVSILSELVKPYIAGRVDISMYSAWKKQLHLKIKTLKSQSLAKGDSHLYLKAANIGVELSKDGSFKRRHCAWCGRWCGPEVRRCLEMRGSVKAAGAFNATPVMEDARHFGQE